MGRLAGPPSPGIGRGERGPGSPSQFPGQISRTRSREDGDLGNEIGALGISQVNFLARGKVPSLHSKTRGLGARPPPMVHHWNPPRRPPRTRKSIQVGASGKLRQLEETWLGRAPAAPLGFENHGTRGVDPPPHG